MRASIVIVLASVTALVVLGPGCGGSTGGSGFGGDDGGSSSGSGGGGSGGGSGGSGSSSGSLLGDGGGSSGGDGSFICSPNPGNYDIPNNGCDDDGDGMVDNVTVCDQSLALQGTAHDFANAIGLCQDTAAGKWGIKSAAYVKGFAGGAANDSQHGIGASFGSVIMPREGSRLGILSSGYAREWDDAAGTGSGSCPNPSMGGMGAPCFKGYQPVLGGPSSAPPGYPKAASACPTQMGAAVLDAINVNLQVVVPLNAQGLQFDFDFYSSEWPEYVCTAFNDGFVAWLTSTAFPGTPPGDLNISFDAKNNPVSVNNAFFDRCTMNAPTGCCAGGTMCGMATGTSACAGGPSELGNTGFEDDGTYCVNASTGGGATGWLTTTAPVKAGETITLQFIIWDTGDNNWDSSVLLDHFRWQPGPTMTGTTRAQ